ncbi:UNVERIFIED_CONTAM: UDP-glycosyltransferase 74B1 [Sesamum latifolium]|uniref:UDP-glycosyltransferase 74B1 n=1 Tax=Sesamum latifolium TaxID=2727402 RepID=A0AAW2ULR4_9LAMI
MEKQKGHVLVVSYPAQGHINPLLQFAKCLASKGLKASFATTRYTVNSINAHGIDVLPISDGFDEGGFKQALSLEAYLESFRIIGSKTLTELIHSLEASTLPINCLVCDSLLPWGLEVATSLGILSVVFLTNSVSVCLIYSQIDLGLLPLSVKPENVPVLLPGLPPLGHGDMPSFMEPPNIYLTAIMEMFASLDQNDFVLANTFQKLEMRSRQTQNMEAAYVNPGAASAQNGSTVCPKLVVYVSFGSMARISANQVEQIAYGLIDTKLSFLWVVREHENKTIPSEFLNRLDSRVGLLVLWCNQLDVLANRAVGCFLTHCGWNSTLEALSLGVPVVAVPQWNDQPMNAKFIEEVWKVGVRGKKDGGGIVRKEEVKR